VFSLPSFRIGRLFGIPLEVNISWLLVFVLVVVALAFSYFPQPGVLPGQPVLTNLLLGLVTALLFFASVIAHEFAHSLVARAQGARIARITLFIFGGVSEMEDEPARPGQEFVMAIAGPGTSILLSAVFFVADGVLSTAGAPPILTAPIAYLAGINLLVGIFNLLPGFPMDGGRVLRSVLWGATHNLLKATRWASRAGQAIGYSMVAVGVFGVLGIIPGGIDLVWLAFLGWFLAGLAESSYQQQVVKSRLSHVALSSVMTSPVLVAPGEIDLETMVDGYFLGRRHSRYPIAVNGELVGMLSLAQAKNVPRERWPDTRAADVADKDLSRLVVPASASVDRVMERLVGGGPGAVLVVDPSGELAGIVTRTDLIHALQSGAGM